MRTLALCSVALLAALGATASAAPPTKTPAPAASSTDPGEEVRKILATKTRGDLYLAARERGGDEAFLFEAWRTLAQTSQLSEADAAQSRKYARELGLVFISSAKDRHRMNLVRAWIDLYERDHPSPAMTKDGRIDAEKEINAAFAEVQRYRTAALGVERMERLTQEEPKNIMAWHVLAMGHLKRYDRPKACAAYEEYKRLTNDPDKVRTTTLRDLLDACEE